MPKIVYCRTGRPRNFTDQLDQPYSNKKRGRTRLHRRWTPPCVVWMSCQMVLLSQCGESVAANWRGIKVRPNVSLSLHSNFRIIDSLCALFQSLLSNSTFGSSP